MHGLIENGLEDYLAGKVRRDFQAHLDACAECRSEVSQFQEMSGLFRSLRASEEFRPEPGFYFRVTQTIEAQTPAPFWCVFSLDAVFGRRVAFASLMAMALVGSFLVSTESTSDAPNWNGTEAVMAAHDVSVPHDPISDRDRVLASLATYEQR